MELTREQLVKLANPTMLESTYDYKNCFVVELAKQLLAEMDKPSVWTDAPDWATDASIHWRNESGSLLMAKVYTRTLPKSRIDEIAEEAVDKYQRGAVGAGSLTDIIKSAILKDREEREASR